MSGETTKDTESIANLIRNYIFKHRLTDGSPLPPPRELAAQLACDETSLIKALRSEEAKQMLSYAGGTWTVLLPETISHHSLSFTRSAKKPLTTKLIEKALREPMDDDSHPFYLLEQQAREALSLPPDSKFIVIERLRLLDQRPGALQRAYLNPARFPEDFLEVHDFEKESLIAIYKQCGYTQLSRDTVLSVRDELNTYQKNVLRGLGFDAQTSAVLDAEQRLYAEDPHHNSRFVLEFLNATYLGGWRYEIKNRPASVFP